jgi:cytochrome P450
MQTLPPGPPGRLLTTYRLLAQQFTYLPRLLETYGDIFTVRTLMGTVVALASPEGARAVYSASPDHFGLFSSQSITPVLGERSITVLTGAPHQRERKLLMPCFHGERMRVYARVMADAAARRLEPAVGRCSMKRVAQDISLDVIIRAVFGVQEDARAPHFADAVIAMTAAMSPAAMFIPFLQHEFGGIGPYARLRRRFAALDALLQEQVERARAQPGNDVLSLMLAARDDNGEPMTDTEIRDELRTLLIAGHDTTAIGLTWAVDLVHRHPQVLARLQDEIDALGPDPDPGQYATLPYLDAVCREALRIRPVVNESVRMLVAPLRIGDYELPAGVGVSPSILLIHQRPDIYPEPAAFRPERFLERKFSPFEYLPFGGGHRRCLGAAFAMFEIKVVLGTMLSRWQIRLLDDEAPARVRGAVTVEPRGGVPVEFQARQGRSAAAEAR